MKRGLRLHRLLAIPLTVEGHSMEPAYHPGDRVWMSRWAYVWRTPARGDVVVIRSPAHPHRLELKRVVGLPSETVEWEGGHRARLGREEYMVVGDNRFHSDDSRLYGPVPRAAIFGKVLE